MRPLKFASALALMVCLPAAAEDAPDRRPEPWSVGAGLHLSVVSLGSMLGGLGGYSPQAVSFAPTVSIERRLGHRWSLLLGGRADYTRDRGPDRNAPDEEDATYRHGQAGVALGARYLLTAPDAWAHVSVDAALTGIYRSQRQTLFEYVSAPRQPGSYQRAVRTADDRILGLQTGLAVERMLARGLSLRIRLDMATAYLFRSRETRSLGGEQEDHEGEGFNLSAPLSPSLELRVHF